MQRFGPIGPLGAVRRQRKLCNADLGGVTAAHFALDGNKEMEKDFAWLCSVLSVAGVRISVAETVFFAKEEAYLWVLTTKEGIFTRKSAFEESNLSASSIIQYFSQSQVLPNPVLCTAMVKGVRLQVTSERIEEAAALKGLFARCAYFQQTVDLGFAAVLYVVRAEMRGNEYQTYFTVRRNGEKDCGDMRLYCKLMVYVKVVLRAVESVRKRRVEALELEFTVGEEGKVWLLGSCGCRLGPATSSQHKGNIEKRKSERRNQGKGVEVPPIVTMKSPLPRLNTPIQFRFLTLPTFLPPQPTSNDPVPLQSLDPRPSIPSPLPQLSPKASRLSVRRPMNFYDSNFKEVLARTWARSKRWLSEDYDCIFLDLDTNVLKEEDPPSKIKRSNTLLRYSEQPSSRGKRQEGKEQEGKLRIETEKSALLRRSESLATSGHNSPTKPPTPPKRLKRHPTKSMSSIEKILALYASPRSIPRFPLKPLSTRHRKKHTLESKLLRRKRKV